MNLFFREFGEGEPLIILHGFLGSSDNWVTLGKIYAEHFKVFIIDQRNHGQSFHSDDFDYHHLTSDLSDFIVEKSLTNVSLIGHSMGGKVVMKYVLENPDQINKLIVADMAPKSYPVDYNLIFSALNAIDIENLKSRGEAERILSSHIADFGMRQFLLKNLTRNGDGYKWKANFKVLEANIEKIGDWSTRSQAFEGPTLFINGKQSDYVRDIDEPTILSHFPAVSRVTIDAGHWLHAEKPNEFMEASLNFLKKPI